MLRIFLESLTIAVAGATLPAAPPRDSVVYRVAATSRFDVLVGKSGAFGFLGHEHLIRARAVAGLMTYHPEAPTASHVAIVIRADSLEVLTPPDTAEIRKVTEVMRTQVLAVAQYPEITFESERVTPIAGGLRVDGRLTIGGVPRPISVDVAVTAGSDTLRATGRFSLKQTDFGITPVRAGGGTVRVADRVTLEFAVVGIRASHPNEPISPH